MRKHYIKKKLKNRKCWCEMLSSIELQEFLRYNVNEILEYYRGFKEDFLNGYERNTERNMAK